MMQPWAVVLLATSVVVGLGSLVLCFVYYCARKRRKRRIEDRVASEIVTAEQGLKRMASSEQIKTQRQVRLINKSMRRIESRDFWHFSRNTEIGRLGFDRWMFFDLQATQIYSVQSLRLRVLNRGAFAVRVSVSLKHSSSEGSANRRSVGISPVDRVLLQPNEADVITLEVMPLEVGVHTGFFRITPHSLENVSFAPYHLPFSIEGRAIAAEIPSFRWEQLVGGTELGRGASGVVYRKDLLGVGTVAIKHFNVDETTQLDVHDFVTEAKTLSQYAHPCIVRLIGMCTEFPNCALVLEYAVHGSLDRYVRPDVRTNAPAPTLDWRLRLKFAIDGARALAYLHRMDVLHRDIKDANFLVESLEPDRSDCVHLKLSDFSLSKLEASSRSGKRRNRITMTGHGTLQWKAVEVISGEPESKGSDVWSFGVVLWQLATQRLPYEGTRFFEIEGLVQSGKRLTVSDVRYRMPNGYAKLVKDCWHERPQQRPSFDDIADALREMQHKSGWRVCDASGVRWEFDADEAEEEEDDDESGDEASSSCDLAAQV